MAAVSRWPRALIAECPVEISADYLDHMLDTDDNTYGWRDYLLFGCARDHLFGKSTRNAGGVICSGWPTTQGKRLGGARQLGGALQFPVPPILKSQSSGKDAITSSFHH